MAAYERFAAGDADLFDTVRDEDAREPLDLLEGQQLAPLEEDVVAPEDLFRHAVDAPEVAPVGDRDPQVAQRPAEGVLNAHNGLGYPVLSAARERRDISERNGMARKRTAPRKRTTAPAAAPKPPAEPTGGRLTKQALRAQVRKSKPPVFNILRPFQMIQEKIED